MFGPFGDLFGRKYIFLLTIAIMGLSTVIVGLLPTSDQIEIAAPIILVFLRILQGLAISGEFGGAAIYVAEHAPPDVVAFIPAGYRHASPSACCCHLPSFC